MKPTTQGWRLLLVLVQFHWERGRLARRCLILNAVRARRPRSQRNCTTVFLRADGFAAAPAEPGSRGITRSAELAPNFNLFCRAPFNCRRTYRYAATPAKLGARGVGLPAAVAGDRGCWLLG